LGVAPLDLEKRLGESPIPIVPKEVMVGIPADLLRRRPDVRRAEHLAAAQGEQIGIAEAALYPTFTLNETIGWEAPEASQLFSNFWLKGAFGPAFQWNLLNYGRIRANVCLQDAKFQELVAAYQETVIRAGAEVESAMVRFLRAHETARCLDRSVANAQKASDIVAKQYKEGDVDFNRIALIEQNLVEQQDRQAQAHGEIVQGLIQVYRALGGGWQAQIPERALDAIPAASPPESGEMDEPESAPMPRKKGAD
jgi:outer membrane protein TolC